MNPKFIYGQATQTFKDTLCIKYKHLKMDYLEKCIEAISKNIAVAECIEVKSVFVQMIG